jgi:hypothetical protein
MDLDASQRTARYAGFEQDTVSHVQESAALGSGSGRSPSQLKGCLDHGGPGWADPRLGAQFGLRGIYQAAQIAQPSHQILSDFDDILPLAAASEKDCKKLCVGECTRPASQQPFSRTSIRRKGKESRHRVSLST